MKLHILHRTQQVPISVREGWEFFSNPLNLSHITPPSLGLEITSDTPAEIYPGAIITYLVRPLFGIPLTWVTEITHVAKPHLFVDEQRFGPYRFWHHTHLIRAIDGGIVVEDLVHYALPLGPIGRIVNSTLVTRQLNEIFDYRQEYFNARFGEFRGKIRENVQI